MTYELIGTPIIQSDYCDDWETVMTIDVQRSDGETGEDVWIVAGVPDYQRGTALAICRDVRDAASLPNMVDVRVFGDSPDMWCPDNLRSDVSDDDLAPWQQRLRLVADGIITCARGAAIAAHLDRVEVTDER